MAKLALVGAITGTLILIGPGSILICDAQDYMMHNPYIDAYIDRLARGKLYSYCMTKAYNNNKPRNPAMKPICHRWMVYVRAILLKPPPYKISNFDTDHTDHDGIWFNYRPEPPRAMDYEPTTIPPAKPMHEGF